MRRLNGKTRFAGLMGIVLAAAAASPPARAGSIAFAPAVGHATGSSGPGPGATTTVTGDFDADGNQDVVITNQNGSGPVVFLGRGDRTFRPRITLSGANGVGAIAAADFDGDGRLDLAGNAGWRIVVLLGNGDGTFRSAPAIAAFENAQPAIAVADANGDGRADILAPIPEGVRAFLGNGDGTFTQGPVTLLFGLLADLQPANLDGDGIADLVVVNATPPVQGIVSLRGLGNGSFTVVETGSTGYGPEAVDVGDLNADGLDDVVSSDSFSFLGSAPSFRFGITVLLSTGGGHFSAPRSYTLGAQGPVSGAIADFDGDGHLDVAISGVVGASVSVFAGDGTGALSEVLTLAVTGYPQTPAAVDLDADCRPEIAVPGPQTLSVARNVSTPPPACPSS